MMAMRDNPFIGNFTELYEGIAYDVSEKQSSLYIASDDENSIFLELLVQELKREVKVNSNGNNNSQTQNVAFLAIRNVEIKPEFRGQKGFTQFVKNLESLNISVLFHDVVNDRLHDFFLSRGYQALHEKKYEQDVVSYYRLAS
jgi:hypothetical protein